MRVILISCVSKKKDAPLPAKELYDSTWFKYAYSFASNGNADKIFILSAKYGLVDPNQIIDPYNVTLKEMTKEQQKEWSVKVLRKLNEECDLQNDRFCFLAGRKYREFLIPHIKYFIVPMEHMGIGKQTAFLKEGVNEAINFLACAELHMICKHATKFAYPFDAKKIPENGIYIMFEKNETGHGENRIVRIGTHTGNKQLRSRLRQHFEMENKDRSIFRKNVGRAILNLEGSSYLKIWNIDGTSQKGKAFVANIRDSKIEKTLESQITNYIQHNFTFVIFWEDSKEKRLELESKIISTVSLCKYCKASERWLGNSSPIEKIKESGLWQVNELYKEPLTSQDLNYLIYHLAI